MNLKQHDHSYDSLKPFNKLSGIPDMVILTGVNGSGKTHFLELLRKKGLLTESDTDSSIGPIRYLGIDDQGFVGMRNNLQKNISSILQHYSEKLDDNRYNQYLIKTLMKTQQLQL